MSAKSVNYIHLIMMFGINRLIQCIEAVGQELTANRLQHVGGLNPEEK